MIQLAVTRFVILANISFHGLLLLDFRPKNAILRRSLGPTFAKFLACCSIAQPTIGFPSLIVDCCHGGLVQIPMGRGLLEVHVVFHATVGEHGEVDGDYALPAILPRLLRILRWDATQDLAAFDLAVEFGSRGDFDASRVQESFRRLSISMALFQL